jgi:ABC-type Mn2+/Zn2+ transport system permease subunit
LDKTDGQTLQIVLNYKTLCPAQIAVIVIGIVGGLIFIFIVWKLWTKPTVPQSYEQIQ